ncbi:MAG: single-stranded-DNA-specific exonuclease RecJ, partial [Oscillospiraceae bacterium]|nr:single-stranded-DNA-specific exonuclease RecJ [Oscillospiraceae bacterium]
MKYGTWAISAPYQEQEAKKLVEAGFSPITAAVLCSRGYSCLSDARDYLASDADLSDPFELVDMDKARTRVLRAVDEGEHIAVFGDYDVDGITATCLLTEFLRSLGAKVTSYIPARLEEGYGLNEIAIRALYEQGVDLIITVDCGITAAEEAQLCRSLGIDLVITDHHECKDTLPTACAVVDPHRRDQTVSHCDLAGVGVAFKLAAAISGDQQALLARFCDLLCLGTVADVMPLTGENRAVVSCGLRALENPQRVGLAALMAECGCEKPPVTAGTIGYTLAPRINAAGRMGQVEIATELFLTNDPKRGAELAQQLCKLNRKRQEIEAGIYQSAVSMLPTDAPPSAIVLADEDWHQGVVGIVASRLAEEYNCPTFLVCLDGEKGKASSRSYGGFNLFRALESLSDLLESYGGHELAAGFTIRRDRIDAFREAICARADEFSQTDECSTALQIDCEIPPSLLTLSNVAAL